MSFKQNVEDHLKHFAQSIGLGELGLNENNACGLCFDDKMIVNIEYLEEDEALVFVASVKPVDAHDNEKLQLFEKLLTLNLQHHSMQGAFLSLNNDKTEILLMKSIISSLDYGLFESTLEKFVNTLEGVINELAQPLGSDKPASQKNKSSGQDFPPPSAGMLV